MDRPTVYLHSTWRSASTYVWAKFRGQPGWRCWFEPLNEHLADATPSFVDRFTPWPYAHHPALDRPYLDEYRPLLEPGGGLANFPAALSLGRFHLQPNEAAPELVAHFSRLDQAARVRGQASVFGCVRTDLRLAWCRAHLRGIHVALRRSPRRQFLSCLAQAVRGNPYFLQRVLAILDANGDDRDLSALATAVQLERKGGSYAAAFFGRPDWQEDLSRLYMVSYGLHRLADRQIASAHAVLDIDRISTDPEAAGAAEQAVRQITGAAVSFADCRIETYGERLRWSNPYFDELEAIVEARLPASQPPDDASRC